MRTVSKTVIGVDFGTQSARAVLVNAENGEIIYSCRKEYPYNSTPVPAIDCAENLPCATDYEMTLYELLRNVIPEEYRKIGSGDLCRCHFSDNGIAGRGWPGTVGAGWMVGSSPCQSETVEVSPGAGESRRGTESGKKSAGTFFRENRRKYFL